MSGDSDPILLSARKSLSVFGLILFFGSLALGFWLLITPLPDWAVPEWVVRSFAGASIPFFASLLLMYIRLLRAPLMRLDCDGIAFCQMDWFAFGPIRWDQVERPRMIAVGPWRMIVIKLRDRRQIRNRGNLFQRTMRAMGAWPLHASFENLSIDANFDELLPRLRRYFDQATSRV